MRGDLFTSKADVIAHQVNCQGVMGSGVALQIKNNSPHVYNEYKKLVDHVGPNACLGHSQLIQLPDGAIANLFGQFNYGRDKKQYTDYAALRHAMMDLKMQMMQKNLKTIAFPDMIGCGLAGGDRDVVLAMIQEIFPKAEIWKL
jgi:O-acetyl-ADP-ribose deacetylase (regulator of RNase III)